MPTLMRAGASRGVPVDILEQKTLAGYDATVLRAESASALAEWLRQNGYDFRPAVAQWLAPYVKDHWTITAFKLSQAPGARDDLLSKTVRLSFETARPFFPYREPADARDAKDSSRRTLRLYFVGEGRFTANTEPEDVWVETEHADRLGSAAASVGGAVPMGVVGPDAWLSVLLDKFRERSNVSELFFFPDAEKAPFHHKVRKSIYLPLDFMFAGLALLWAVRRRRRKAAANGA
jgi:hypothetical protein